MKTRSRLFELLGVSMLAIVILSAKGRCNKCMNIVAYMRWNDWLQNGDD